jgi:hypothetical protein
LRVLKSSLVAWTSVNCNFLSKKLFICIFFFSFWSESGLDPDPDPDSLKMLDLDPDPDPDSIQSSENLKCRVFCSGIRNHRVQHELCALRGDRGEWICPTEAAGRPFREELQTAVSVLGCVGG